MKRRWIRVVLWISLIAAVLVTGAVLIVPPVGRVLARRQVEAAIARFEAEPSQEGVRELVGFLDGQTATPEQGERILKMVLYPRVVTRAAYPLGPVPVFTVERPFRVHVPRATVSSWVRIWIDDQERHGGSGSGGNSFDAGPHFWRLAPTPEVPGLYTAEVRHRYWVTAEKRKVSWFWHPLRGRFPRSLLPYKRVMYSRDPNAHPHYQCQFSVPVQLKIVEPDQAEKIDLVSDSELDDRMLKAFSKGSAKMGGTYSTPAGKRSYEGGIEIKCNALPVAVAFKTALRLADGEVITPCDGYPERFRARANTSRQFHVTIRSFQLEEPRTYDATIILTPDAEYAYGDPAIKAIWGGTLEFPISFTVSEEPAVR